MKAVTHPFTNDKPTLTEDYTSLGVWTFNVERIAKYSRAGQSYRVREFFATIRPAYNSAGMLDSSKGVVVLRNDFDEVRGFSDFFTAKTYVESLFVLEFAAG